LVLVSKGFLQQNPNHMPNIPQNQHFIFSSLELFSPDFLEADPSHMPLKETVARDFQRLVFLVNRPHMGSIFTP
jgi:hypothetical protein